MELRLLHLCIFRHGPGASVILVVGSCLLLPWDYSGHLKEGASLPGIRCQLCAASLSFPNIPAGGLLSAPTLPLSRPSLRYVWTVCRLLIFRLISRDTSERNRFVHCQGVSFGKVISHLLSEISSIAEQTSGWLYTPEKQTSSEVEPSPRATSGHSTKIKIKELTWRELTYLSEATQLFRGTARA